MRLPGTAKRDGTGSGRLAANYSIADPVPMGQGTMTIGEFLRIVFIRQRAVTISVFAVAMLATAAVTFTRPHEYETTATLFVGENRPISTGASAVALDEVLAQTYASLLETPDIEAKAADALGPEIDSAVVDDQISFEVATGTRLITITAVDENPAQAALLANTYAETFVEDRQQSGTRAGNRRLNALSKQVGEKATEVQRLRDNGSQSELAQAETELAALRAAYRENQQSVSLQGNDVSVSSTASVPTAPARPRPKLYMAIGAVLAAILAVAAAFARNLFDRRVRDEAELTEILDAPVLARVPATDELAHGYKREQLTEAFQFLRANLRMQGPEGPRRVISVVSALPGDGKSFVTRNLATAVALSGGSVIGVDCDLRRPTLAKGFNVDAKHGLMNVLLGTHSVDDVLVNSGLGGPRVLPTGPLPPNPAALLSLDSFSALLEDLRRRHGSVIVDAPPIMVGAESSVITAASDGVVIVVDPERARRDALIAARAQLEKAGATVIGIVLNRMPERSSKYSYYGGYRQEKDAEDESSDTRAGNGRAPRPRARS
ncbi:MAG: polysaccharide biosynthesis tyrosine autokinase [Solirubrobacterales bacterium]